jgi:5-methyltetrahydrofolate--homocysteine methyltransferase
VCYSHGDFISPKGSGVEDYIGIFAVSSGFGVDELKLKFQKDNDDYSVIMLDSIADRLAEAIAEKLHADVRTNYWGYAKSESLTLQDKLKVKYQGIRPAPGYPSQPDHTEKSVIWDLLKVLNHFNYFINFLQKGKRFSWNRNNRIICNVTCSKCLWFVFCK